MSDQQVIDEVLLGNQSMFRLLVEKYQSMVFTTAMGFVHSKEDAEDLTQDIFVKAWEALSTYKGDAVFSTWLYRITINRCINHVEKNKRNIFLELAEEWMNKLFNTESTTKDSQQQMEEAEQDVAIRRAIDSLPVNQRTVFVLSAYDELPQKEIAVIMQRTEGAVEQLLQRAKTNLRKKLAHSVGN